MAQTYKLRMKVNLLDRELKVDVDNGEWSGRAGPQEIIRGINGCRVIERYKGNPAVVCVYAPGFEMKDLAKSAMTTAIQLAATALMGLALQAAKIKPRFPFGDLKQEGVQEDEK